MTASELQKVRTLRVKAELKRLRFNDTLTTSDDDIIGNALTERPFPSTRTIVSRICFYRAHPNLRGV